MLGQLPKLFPKQTVSATRVFNAIDP